MRSRDTELLQRSHEAMTHNLSALHSIAVLNQQENKTLAALAVQGRKDSQTMKALTAMATVYLPGSLIAVSHGS